MPIPVKAIHSDNGSEFINAYLKKFCSLKKIQFSRSRPYRKNNAPYVESKNWSMVRAYIGWLRYDTEHNFFMPQMKLIQKERQRGKVKKSYEMDIPINRVIRLDFIENSKELSLIKLRNSIDIVWLSEEIERLTEVLSLAYEKKLRRLNHEKV